MRVVAEESFTFFYNHAPIAVAEGDAVDSDIAVFLLRSKCAVRPDDTDAEHLAASLRGEGAGEPPEPTEGIDVDPDTVPDGTMEVILEWVGGDADRARRAREAETVEGGKNRSTLISRLDTIIG